ncbi:hypothetical protein [Pontibaca salina]|uniref:Uncharacterized protein n=1 Tax=Pontibaca salina TaxID=2795731 RepID=A0A934HTL1_9RHOB|nr:hypothetical protein [Pontibaca salina]MBI6630515.1 hypothetical protein [Pontibaca salina]
MTRPVSPRFWTRGRLIGIGLALTVVAVFAAANAHLISVAFSSQPDCVPHLKTATEGAASYRAAKPSC